MKSKKNWKKNLGFSLFVLVVLPTGILALTDPVRNDMNEVIRYQKLAKNYQKDCGKVTESNDPKYKECLEKAKVLRDQLLLFISSAENVVNQIKSKNKWNEELDKEFPIFAPKNGVDTATLSKIKNAGGPRPFYNNIIRELNEDKGLLDDEIKKKEANPKANSSSQIVFGLCQWGIINCVINKVEETAKTLYAICKWTTGICS